MSLRLIYGRAGTGKSEFCFQEIKKYIKKTDKIYMITPEQFSFTAEKRLLKTIEEECVIQAEIITFQRMAYRILEEVGGKTKTNLSNSGRTMLLYDILTKNKNELTFLGNSKENVEVIQRTLTDLKKHNVKQENLKKVIESIEDNYLKTKLEDIEKIYRQYNQKIGESYLEEDELLNILVENLPQSKIFQNSIVYIDEFVGFTTQEYKVIEKLLKQAKIVNVTVCMDILEDARTPQNDIFYSNKQTVQKLFECAKNVGCIIDKPVYLKEGYRFRSMELQHLEQQLYGKIQAYTKEIKDIHLYVAQNPYSEIDQVAKTILKLVKNEQYRFKDISVITKNLDEYVNSIKAIFKQYQIPFFVDEKKELSQNILVKYVLSILEILVKNWSFESMFQYIKTGLLGISQEEIYELENYCLEFGIKGNKWQSVWRYGKEERLPRLNELRFEIIRPLIQLKEKLKESKNVKEMTQCLYNFLVENEIFLRVEKKIENLELLGELEMANEYRVSYKSLMNLFDEMVLLFGEEKMGFEKYRELLKMGLSKSEIGAIPATLDQVIIGDVDRSRSHKVKAVYIIGLNDAIFPSIHKNEGFLNDSDREKLKQCNVEIAKGTLEQLYEDQFNIYKAFTTAEEKLYLSYTLSDRDSKALRPSLLIKRLKRIFPNLQEESDITKKEAEKITKETTFQELLEKIRNYSEQGEMEKEWFTIYSWYLEHEPWKTKLQSALRGLSYTNKSENIDEEKVHKLYGDTLKTSISKLEQYRRCPFSFHMKYGLKLEERKTFSLQSIDTGNFMHEVIEEFFTKIKEEKQSVKELSKEQIKEKVDNIVEEKLALSKNYIFTSTKKFILLTNRLKKVILQSLQYIIYQLKLSDFEVFGNEIEFAKQSTYPPMEIKLENGQKIEIIGKIDRVDIAKTKERKIYSYYRL